MKKALVAVLLMALLGGQVFATVVPTIGPRTFTFDVQGDVLTEAQAEDVKGEGVVGAVAGAIVGGVLGGVISSSHLAIDVVRGNGGSPREGADRILSGMTEGAIGGAISGGLGLVF